MKDGVDVDVYFFVIILTVGAIFTIIPKYCILLLVSTEIERVRAISEPIHIVHVSRTEAYQ